MVSMLSCLYSVEAMYRFLPIPFQDKGMRWAGAAPKTQLLVVASVTSFFSFVSIKQCYKLIQRDPDNYSTGPLFTPMSLTPRWSSSASSFFPFRKLDVLL